MACDVCLPHLHLSEMSRVCDKCVAISPDRGLNDLKTLMARQWNTHRLHNHLRSSEVTQYMTAHRSTEFRYQMMSWAPVQI